MMKTVAFSPATSATISGEPATEGNLQDPKDPG